MAQSQHGFMFHQYADDCQIYVSSPVSAVHSAIEQFSHCLQDVEAWMSASRLRLNPSKTVVLWLCSRHIIDKLDVYEVQVLSSTVKVDSSARDLGDDIRRLCSAVSFTCALPRTRTRLGDRSFTVAGPRVWNFLPAALRAVEDYERFKKLLKHICSIRLRRLVTFCF